MKKAGFIDYIILLRPTLFVPFWNIYLVGYHFSGERFSLKGFLGIFLFTMMMGGVYILNQIVDIASDKINKKLFLLSDGYISSKSALYLMSLLFIISLPLSFHINTPFGIIFIISFIIGIIYSGGPLKLKDRPFLDMLSNGIGYGTLSFLLGYSVNGVINYNLILRTIPYFFAVSSVFLNTTIPDIPGDRYIGKKTTGVLLGKKRTLLLALLFDVLSILSSIILKDKICLISSLLSFPLFLLAFLKPDKKIILFSIRINPLFLTLIVCILFPPYLLLLSIIFIFQKLYYKKKFNIDYPSIKSGIESDF